MITSTAYPGGHTIKVYGQEWYFSARALDALEINGPITDATLHLCAMYLRLHVAEIENYFEVDYFQVLLRGDMANGAVLIDAREGPLT